LAHPLSLFRIAILDSTDDFTQSFLFAEASPPWTLPAAPRRRRRMVSAIRTLQIWDWYVPCSMTPENNYCLNESTGRSSSRALPRVPNSCPTLFWCSMNWISSIHSCARFWSDV
jgi:hypothetical protein